MKKIVLLLLIHTLMLCLASCAFVEQFHYCESACEECGGCRDLDCHVSICANKCDGNHPAHQHSLTKVEGTLPTCEESGVEAYFACECGKMFSDEAGENEIETPVVLDALGHSEEVVSGYNATCTETGLTDGKKCSVCGVTTLEQEEIPAKEHSFTNYASNNDATCTADGTKTAKCDRCDVTDTLADEGSKLAHSFTNYVSNGNATCIADGTKTAKCEGCDATDTVVDEGSKTAHTFTNYVSDGNATCIADGTKTAKCEGCDATDTVVDEGSKTAHTFTNYVSDGNATCIADGTKTAKCDGCDATDTIADEGSKLNHSFTNYVSNGNATCIADGTKTAKCDNCDATDTLADEGSKADHSFTNYVSNGDATCTADGTKTAKCDGCDATDTLADEGSKLAHSFTNYVSNGDATCTADGTKTAKCEGCDATDTIGDEGTKLAHSFTNYVPNGDATCTADGTKTAKCEGCDATDTLADEGSKLAHSFTNYVSNGDATCTADGTKTAKCDGCDATDTVVDEGSKTAHTFTNYVSNGDATCTADGTKTAKCDNCDATDTLADEGSKLAHSFTNYVSNGDATCTADGTKTAKCDNCDATDTLADEGSKLAHSFTNYVPNGDATCTADGTKTAKCDRCDVTDTLADEGSKLNHSFTNYVSNEDATCTQDGTKTAKCDRCDETDTKADEGSAKGHTPAEAVQENIVPASCKDSGSYDSVVYCAVEGCKVELSRETKTIPATGDHVYATEKEKVAATCEEDGYVIIVCGCGEEQRTTLGATGHTEAIDDAVASTCTGTGLTEGKHCSICNKTIVPQEETPAKGHSFTNYVSNNDASCTADGTKTAKCDRCDATDNIADEGSAKGHTDEIVAGKAATCTETGLTEGKKCSVCGVTTLEQEEIPALGHNIVVDEAVAPTCNAVGKTEGYHCTRCDDATLAQEDIPKTAAHSFDEGVITQNPTENSNGVKTYTCTDCGHTKTEVIDRIEVGDITSQNTVFTHNFTKEDQSAQNTNPPEGRVDLTYYNINTTTSKNILKALALASNGDYLTHFYAGAAVTVNFTSSVSGKATVTFKIASGYLTYVSSNYTQYQSGDMIVNKIMKFTVNGKDIVIGDDVVLNGDSTTGDYSINGKWTDVSFEIDVKAGNNTIVLTSIFPDDGTGKSLYIDHGKTGTQSSFNLDTMTVNLTSVSYDLTADNDSLVHNFTGADQTAKNDNNPPSNRVNVSYVSTATASATAQLATKLATNEDYLGQFYGGAAVTYSFTSSVSGKATITFKISSGYLTKVSGKKYETGDMVVNKVMKITVNGEEIIFGDDVVLNGDKTKQSYACMANWTYLTFEVDLLKGANTIVLTSLYPVDGEGNLLYKDPGTNGTQSSFLLDTVSVALVKPDLSNEVNSFTHNYTTADQSAKNNENPPHDRVNVNYVSTAGASATAQLATKLATNEDYLSYFYGGAAVTKTFISTVSGKATVTFKIASGYITKAENPVYESGDMIVNKVMKFTVNGVDIVIGDDVVLNGDTTTQTYACLANWTYVTFEIDVVEGENTIVLTSLCPKDENGEPLYKDPGVDGTQSSFHLDTVTVTLK